MQGLINGVVQVTAFPPLRRLLGAKALYRLSISCYLLIFTAWPLMHWLVVRKGSQGGLGALDFQLWIVLAIQLLVAMIAGMGYSEQLQIIGFYRYRLACHRLHLHLHHSRGALPQSYRKYHWSFTDCKLFYESGGPCIHGLFVCLLNPKPAYHWRLHGLCRPIVSHYSSHIGSKSPSWRASPIIIFRTCSRNGCMLDIDN